jgi:phage terminase large subunit GpA-like protein
VSLWADTHRRLTKHASQYSGKWKTDRFPYQRGPMEAFSNTKTRLIVMKWATQLGKTESLLNCIGWAIDESPGPVLVVYPNETTLKKISTTRIQPMINSCAPLAAKKHTAADKFKLAEMHFSDCLLYLSSAQTPADLASMPIQYLFCDEVGKFPVFSGKEGDPVKLAMERQKSFPYTSKTVLVSSPTTPDGAISRYYNACEEKLQFFIPCPHCGKFQTLIFEHIKWETGDYETSDPLAWREANKTAMYFCPECGTAISDNEKIKSLPAGKWLRANGTDPDPEAVSIGFELSSLYTPLLKWGQMAAEFLDAKQDIPRLMVYVNGWLCQEWEDAAVERKDPETVLEKNKIDLPPRTVPPDTVALTMGIDSQATGFYFVVRAWSRDRTSTLVDFGFLPSFHDIEQVIFENSYQVHGENHKMAVWRAAIDTGGTRIDSGPSMTEATYAWLRKNSRNIVWGVKGSSWKTGVRVKHTILDRMPGKSGKRIPGGLVLFMVDTNAFKEAIHYRLSIPAEEPGAYLFHSETSEPYMMQLLSEYKRRDARTGKESWEPIKGRENHFLDCEVYAMACADTQWQGGLEVLSRPQGVVDVSSQGLKSPPQWGSHSNRKRRVINRGVS